MPVGVPTNVATTVITTLPKIAFSRPPLLPGGGVIWVNSVGLIAEKPSYSNVHRTKTSHTKPNAVAAVDNVMTSALVNRRRA